MGVRVGRKCGSVVQNQLSPYIQHSTFPVAILSLLPSASTPEYAQAHYGYEVLLNKLELDLNGLLRVPLIGLWATGD